MFDKTGSCGRAPYFAGVTEGSRWYWVARWLATRIFQLMGGMKVVGAENVPLTGTVILAPVHLSYVDPPLVGCACPRAISFMSREEFFGFPYGVLLRSLNAFPLRRGESDAGAVKLALSLLEEERCLLMFPEGTRGRNGQLGPMQSGISMLAKRSGAKIVPVGLAGPEKMWPRDTKRIRRARLTVLFGPAFTYEEVAGSADKRAGRDQFSHVLAERMIEAAAEAGLTLRISPENQGRKMDGPPQTPSAQTAP